MPSIEHSTTCDVRKYLSYIIWYILFLLSVLLEGAHTVKIWYLVILRYGLCSPATAKHVQILLNLPKYNNQQYVLQIDNKMILNCFMRIYESNVQYVSQLQFNASPDGISKSKIVFNAILLALCLTAGK